MNTHTTPPATGTAAETLAPEPDQPDPQVLLPRSRRQRRDTQDTVMLLQVQASDADGTSRVETVTTPRRTRRAVSRALHLGRSGGDSSPGPSLPGDAPAFADDAQPGQEVVDGWAGVEMYQPKGALLRANARAAARGVYAPRAQGAPTTTRQGEILNTALLASPSHPEALAIGNDKVTRSMVNHDPFTAYARKEITSPSVLIIGVVGSAKSSLMKTVYVVRPLILHKRRVVQIDRKDQEGEGEYAPLNRALGGEPFKMLIGDRDHGTVLNVLDPVITDVIGHHQVQALIRAMIEKANNGQRIDEWGNEALRVALLRTLEEAERREKIPTLNELVPQLGVMDDHRFAFLSDQAKERMHQAGAGLRFVLTRTVSEELHGLFDGPTSAHVNLDSKLTTFDISQLPQDSPAAGMVMAVAQTWTIGRLRKERGYATYFNVEEGWDMVSGPIGRALKSQQLLARGLGLCTVTALHHVRQVAETSEGREMLQEPQTIHLFRQDREEDVQACLTNFNLDPDSAETLRNQDPGNHLMKISNRPEIPVEHIRSSLEEMLTDTDGAMTAIFRNQAA